MLIKYTGKYVNIYFIMKITFCSTQICSSIGVVTSDHPYLVEALLLAIPSSLFPRKLRYQGVGAFAPTHPVGKEASRVLLLISYLLILTISGPSLVSQKIKTILLNQFVYFQK